MGKANTIGLIFLLLVILAILIAGFVLLYKVNPVFDDQVLTAPNGLSSYFETTEYKIDPTTILENLKEGEKNVFTLVMATPETDERLYTEPFPWKQLDYLNIANALHQYVWKETLDGWHVFNLSFYGDCEYNTAGFDLFQVTYFKYVGSQQYTAHEIDIFPLYAGVATGGGTNFPRPLFGWNESLDLDRLKITANDALRIAEQNGGKDARLAFGNKCKISVFITSNDQKWTIIYHEDSDAKRIFEINIDPYTGKYKIQK